MKIKTNELTDRTLDWAVAKIVKLPKDVLVITDDKPVVHRTYMGEITILRCEFSTNWAQGGPIIEREGITIEWQGWGGDDQWLAYIKHDEEFAAASPLVAAMRCYVASCIGDEVEIPDEVTA